MKKCLYIVLWSLLLGQVSRFPPQALPQMNQGGNSSPSQPRYQVPPGFVVETAAAPEKTGSIVAMTFDSKGRPVLSRERGPVFILEDRDRDGVFETFLTFTESVKNCQGLYFLGSDLLAVGDGPSGTGLYRINDRDGDSAGEETALLGRFVGGMGEHGPHSVFLGPDGFIYLDVGNHSGVEPTPDPLSPHRNYYEGSLLPVYYDPRGHARQVRAPGGTIVRIDPEARNWELFAGGFRNSYDSAFNALGELFTWDSDMEWDIDLPWYRACRTVHIIPGGEYGWRSGSGNWPDYFIDNLPPMMEQGRGSPVGVEFYLHDAYPERYRNAFILGDWSRGRILLAFLSKEGATYREHDEEFVLGEPLNVTDLEIGQDGFLYFVTGGRNTEGGLYRVAYRGADAKPKKAVAGLEAALEQPQHRSAWGRARLLELRRRLGRKWERGLVKTARDGKVPATRRVRALELLQVYGPAPGFELLKSLGEDPAWEVRGASTYYLGMHSSTRTRLELAARLRDLDPFVRRRAVESIVRTRLEPSREPGFDVNRDLLPLLGDSDRFVRYSAGKAIQRTNRNIWRRAVLQEARPLAAIEGLLALVQTMRGTNDLDILLRRELELLKTELSNDDLLRLLRVIQLTLLNDQAVERPQLYKELGNLVLSRLPARDLRVDRELAVLAAHLQVEGAVEKLTQRLESPGFPRPDQIFYAYCLRNLRSAWTEEAQRHMVEWFARTQKEKWKGGASFVAYLEYIWNSWRGNLPYEDQSRATNLLATLAPPPPVSEGVRASSFMRASDTNILSDQELAEYLTWDPMAYRRQDTKENGARLYEKALCANCHLFNGLGFEAGPDLTDIRRRFKRKDLVEAIMFPDKAISDLWEPTEIVTTGGETLLGTVASEDDREIVLNQIGGKTVIAKERIRSRGVGKRSLMPAGLFDNLTLKETVNLLLFLETGR